MWGKSSAGMPSPLSSTRKPVVPPCDTTFTITVPPAGSMLQRIHHQVRRQRRAVVESDARQSHPRFGSTTRLDSAHRSQRLHLLPPPRVGIRSGRSSRKRPALHAAAPPVPAVSNFCTRSSIRAQSDRHISNPRSYSAAVRLREVSNCSDDLIIVTAVFNSCAASCTNICCCSKRPLQPAHRRLQRVCQHCQFLHRKCIRRRAESQRVRRDGRSSPRQFLQRSHPSPQQDQQCSRGKQQNQKIRNRPEILPRGSSPPRTASTTLHRK